ncbi:MAG: twin-arginine translocase subunit TatC [Haloarculaceae archaeon]
MSGAVDEDTRRTIQEGRETVGAMLSAAQSDLQKVFIVAVVGLVGTIYVLRRFVWGQLKTDLFSQMAPGVREATKVVAITPFDVILLQVKIGIVIGLLLALPVLIWYSRDALRARGLWPGERVPRWRLAVLALFAVALFVGGIAYSYEVFFPLMFSFLASNAVNVGFDPTYSIVKWAQFVFLVALSFGLAAELPLVMSGLSYTGIVPYETFRDKWRHAMVVIFTFGALFTPPDPVTQVMWASPLVILYGFSLQLTKVVVTAKRSGDAVDLRGLVRRRWNVLAGVGVLSFAAVYAYFTRGGVAATNALLARALSALPWDYHVALPGIAQATGLSTTVGAALVGVVVALVAVLVAGFVLASRALAAAAPAAGAGPSGSPAAIDLGELDAAGIRAAPPEAFDALSEDEAVDLARQAMDAEQPETAQAILDRFDEAEERTGAEQASDAEADGAEAAAAEEEEAGRVTQTAAGMMNAFTEDETTEEDVGGYYFDAAYILESLTSKAFRLVAVFMVVLAGTFGWLYTGGIKSVKDSFFSQMPTAVQPEVHIVTLHPVEALLFEIKFSTLLAIVATLPLVLYYAWPAMKERGWVRGDPRIMLVWGGSLLAGIAIGSVVGFLYVAPAVISWLAADAVRSHMVIAYRINTFGWLVIYTTVGVGLLAEIPVSMTLFHVGGIVSYDTMQRYWREVVVALFAASALLSPRGVFTMLLMAIPAALAYLLGLAVLWVITLGGRRGRPRATGTGAD